MKSFSKRAILIGFGLSLAACVTRGEIEELKTNQEKILAKLDQILKTGGGAGAAAQRQRGPDPAKVYGVPVDGSPSKGPQDAWVTIVEISEFQCPFCKRVLPTMKELEEKYGSDLRVVFKHNPLPFHNRAMFAAMAAECANEQGKFWKMHDVLFENQRALEDSDLENYAKQAGADVAKWKACYAGSKAKPKVEGDQATSAKFGAKGTPAFFINGRYLSGAQPTQNFAALIDEELKKAKDSGVAKKDYYQKQVVEKGEKAIQ